MTSERIEAVIDCQSDLIAAIDRQDSDAIVRASEALALAVSQLGNAAQWPDFAPTAARLRKAMEQNQAALQRLNLLRYWTRQRIDRMEELRINRAR